MRFKFASVSVSSNSKTDFGFVCPIEGVVLKSERPMGCSAAIIKDEYI